MGGRGLYRACRRPAAALGAGWGGESASSCWRCLPRIASTSRLSKRGLRLQSPEQLFSAQIKQRGLCLGPLPGGKPWNRSTLISSSTPSNSPPLLGLEDPGSCRRLLHDGQLLLRLRTTASISAIENRGSTLEFSNGNALPNIEPKMEMSDSISIYTRLPTFVNQPPLTKIY